MVKVFSDPAKTEKDISVWLIQYLYIELDSGLTAV